MVFCSIVGFFIYLCIRIRDVAQLVAHYVRDVGVGRSSRLIPTNASQAESQQRPSAFLFCLVAVICLRRLGAASAFSQPAASLTPPVFPSLLLSATPVPETISAITDRVLPEITAWKSRMLDPVYAICWLDAIHYKVKDDKGRAVTRAIYNVLGINKSGHKGLLGMYISESEGANFWLDVMTDLQNRGVRDILICCVDGLKGFPDAIQSVFPETSVQLCVVHQIRNSIKYVGSKHQKEFLKNLKTVYGAVSKDSALAQLDMVDEKWGEMYPIVIKSWRDNWGASYGRF